MKRRMFKGSAGKTYYLIGYDLHEELRGKNPDPEKKKLHAELDKKRRKFYPKFRKLIKERLHVELKDIRVVDSLYAVEDRSLAIEIRELAKKCGGVVSIWEAKATA